MRGRGWGVGWEVPDESPYLGTIPPPGHISSGEGVLSWQHRKITLIAARRGTLMNRCSTGTILFGLHKIVFFLRVHNLKLWKMWKCTCVKVFCSILKVQCRFFPSLQGESGRFYTWVRPKPSVDDFFREKKLRKFVITKLGCMQKSQFQKWIWMWLYEIYTKQYENVQQIF